MSSQPVGLTDWMSSQPVGIDLLTGCPVSLSDLHLLTECTAAQVVLDLDGTFVVEAAFATDPLEGVA